MVGAGLVGLASAYRLLEAMPGSNVVVLEKEGDVARHQSGNNSGVLHAGLYYTPGSLKATLAVSGLRQMKAFCRLHDVPHEVCGKLVVATSDDELQRLRELMRRGQANGLRGIEWLDATSMREIEPNVGGVAAIHVPEEGIVDYARVARALVLEIVRLGGRVVTGAEVRALRSNAHGWIAETGAGAFEGTMLVNCAGLQCDRIARMAGERPALRIVPFRGEYFVLRPDRQHLIRNLIYPVPDPAFPFLGVHLTRMIKGGVEAGPNAVLAFAREGYRRRDFNMRDMVDAMTFPGLWKFLARYPSIAWRELRHSFRPEYFARALQRLVPGLHADDLRPGGAGVRAQAMRPDGALVNDFVVREGLRAVHLLNAPSPAATASLAIGELVARRVAARIR